MGDKFTMRKVISSNYHNIEKSGNSVIIKENHLIKVLYLRKLCESSRNENISKLHISFGFV